MDEQSEWVVEAVSDANVAALIQYCAEHGSEHDDSYLPGASFAVSAEQPSYLLLDHDEIAGAISLMRTDRFTQAGKARFSIFHSVSHTEVAYRRLFDAIQPHIAGLQEVYLFIPEQRRRVRHILEGLGFAVSRYSFVLVNRDLHRQHPEFPANFAVRGLTSDDDAGLADFARQLNINFAELAGHADISAEEIRCWFDDDEYLDGGLSVLETDGRVIGTAWVTREYGDEDRAELSALGVAPPYRGSGFGRGLLRWASRFALDHGFQSLVLSVNAENEQALQLYRTEGYELIETVVCYTFSCS
ncbi:MAG: GNAT family N-acetyltransferase [Anaerolineales bacterium]